MRGHSKKRAVSTCMFAVGLALTGMGLMGPSRASAVSAPTFGAPIKLPSSTGGEPSIALDYRSCSVGLNCNVYIVSPNATAAGPAEWYSSDSGASWAAPVQIDTLQATHGGDTDVTVQPGNGNVIVTDLNVSNAFVQVSTDHGHTFNTGFPTAYEDDRPWLTASGTSTVYLAYHDFVGEVPIVCTSTDGGNTFVSCNHAFTNTHLSDCAENTVPARYFSVDPTDNSLNFMYSCSTASENAAHPPYGPLHDYYLARSTNGGLVYDSTSPVFIADTNGKAPNFANIFGNFAIDAAGTYYAMFSGTFDDNHDLTNPFNVYYTFSTNKGATWNGPYKVNTDGGTHTLASFAVTGKGNIDAIWYADLAHVGEPNGQCGSTGQTTACMDGTTPVGFDGQSGKKCPAISSTNAADSCPIPGNWKVYMTQSTNADTVGGGAFSAPQAIDPNYRHYGTICTNGLVCGGASDRHLLDFISVAVDCAGLAHVTYGADQNTPTAHTVAHSFTDGPLETDVVNQTGGSAIAAPLGCAGAMVIPEMPLAVMAPLAGLFVVGAVGYTRRSRRASYLPELI